MLSKQASATKAKVWLIRLSLEWESRFQTLVWSIFSQLLDKGFLIVSSSLYWSMVLAHEMEMGRSYSKIKGQQVDKAMHSGSQGEGRGREDDQAEDGKMT